MFITPSANARAENGGLLARCWPDLVSDNRLRKELHRAESVACNGQCRDPQMRGTQTEPLGHRYHPALPARHTQPGGSHQPATVAPDDSSALSG